MSLCNIAIHAVFLLLLYFMDHKPRDLITAVQPKALWKSCVECAATSAVIIMLMAMATIFGSIMTLEQISERIALHLLRPAKLVKMLCWPQVYYHCELGQP